MKYLASLVLLLSLGTAASFAADPVEKASPISNKQAKDLVKADSNLKKAHHRKHHHHKAAAKAAGAAPAASPAPDAAAPATK